MTSNASDQTRGGYSSFKALDLPQAFKDDFWKDYQHLLKADGGALDYAFMRTVAKNSNKLEGHHLDEFLRGDLSFLAAFGVPGFGSHVSPSTQHGSYFRTQLNNKRRTLRDVMANGVQGQERINAINGYRNVYVEWIIQQVLNWFRMRKGSYNFVQWFLEKTGNSAMVKTAEQAAAVAASRNNNLPGEGFDLLQFCEHVGIDAKDFLHFGAHPAWDMNQEARIFPSLQHSESSSDAALHERLYHTTEQDSPRSRGSSDEVTVSSDDGVAAVKAATITKADTALRISDWQCAKALGTILCTTLKCDPRFYAVQKFDQDRGSAQPLRKWWCPMAQTNATYLS